MFHLFKWQTLFSEPPNGEFIKFIGTWMTLHSANSVSFKYFFLYKMVVNFPNFAPVMFSFLWSVMKRMTAFTNV